MLTKHSKIPDQLPCSSDLWKTETPMSKPSNEVPLINPITWKVAGSGFEETCERREGDFNGGDMCIFVGRKME